MGAGPPKGNTNAEKWTHKESESIFLKAIKLANERNQHQQKDGSIVYTSYKHDFIGEVARELGYYKSLFTELKNKYADLEPLHRKLVETLEANCFCNSKKGFIKEATAIVNLKSNHKWTDRQQTDITTKGDKLGAMSQDELLVRLELAKKIINGST